MRKPSDHHLIFWVMVSLPLLAALIAIAFGVEAVTFGAMSFPSSIAVVLALWIFGALLLVTTHYYRKRRSD
jgi:hypothetical protein